MKRPELDTDGPEPEADEETRAPSAAAPESAATGAPENGGGGAAGAPVPGEASPEPSGLTGVDVAPLPPPRREELEALRQERDELRDQLLRKRAEFDNYRKRMERDRQQAAQEATAALVRALIPTLDNLERALRAVGDEEALRRGVDLIHRDLRLFLEGQGLIALDPAGERFDPQHHQAIAHEPAPGFDEGCVVEVLQKGYFFKDRLLRPAMVKVAKGTVDKADGEPEAIH